MGGAWRVASLIPNSCIHCGSPKEACPSLASFLQSSIPGTVNNLVHQSRVSHFSTFHGTHWLNSKTAGSRGILSPSSLEVSSDPLRKEASASFSSGGSSKSEPSLVAPSSLGPVFRSAGWLGQGGLQTAPTSISSFALPYFIPSSPFSWILPLVLSGSGRDLAYLLLKGSHHQHFLVGFAYHGQTSLH